MELCDAAVYCDSWFESICPLPGANPDFVVGKSLLHFNRASSMLFGWYDTGSCSSFHQSFAAHRPCYLIQRFRTLIHQSKRLYTTALLFSLCAPWPIGVFWHCFASLAVISRLQFCHISLLHWVFSSQYMLVHFSWHWFRCAVMFWVVSFLSCMLMTDEIVLCSCC